MKPLISTAGLNIGYHLGRSSKTILSNLNLKLYPGELTALIGPNGAGKSTLLRTLSGNLKKLSGEIYLEDKIIESYSNLQLAHFRSIVTTERQEVDYLTVNNMVAMGRFPYTNWQGALSDQDISIIEKSIQLTGLQNFKDREINKLSDGERQKSFIARALAQSTKVIILDEPTAFLDLANKIKVMDLLKRIAYSEGKGILLSTHDLDLALLLSDTLWIMNNSSVKAGVPEDLILDGSIRNIFDEDNFSFDETSGRFVFDFNNELHANIEGEGVGRYWLARALERKGFILNKSDHPQVNVKCIDHEGTPRWILRRSDCLSEHNSIQSLLRAIRD